VDSDAGPDIVIVTGREDDPPVETAVAESEDALAETRE